jgi:thioester reductase-like protein
VTGATGNLGSFLLAGLVKMENVSKVVALVRATDESSAHSRVLTSLSSRGLHLTEQEMSKFAALPSDFSRSDLGLSNDNLQTLLSTLTHVIHSAWAVNFNLGVRSFEAQHIQGVHHLLHLCLSVRLASPAKFFFCSSVSVAGGTPKPSSVPETMIVDLNHAQKMGYGRSKLVSEHIVHNAMKQTGMTAQVLRIGQLAGDGVTGIWNDTEAVPLMIRSAMSIGALPELDEVSSIFKVLTRTVRMIRKCSMKLLTRSVRWCHGFLLIFARARFLVWHFQRQADMSILPTT